MTQDITFSIGAEVEHTPAFSKKTLFVEGIPPIAEILKIATREKVLHVRLHSTAHNKAWNELLTAILDAGFWATLEYPVNHHHVLATGLSAGVWQCKRFVPLINVNISNLLTSGNNLTIKFDSETNDGVWAWNQHELADHNKFTGWQDYDDRVVIDSCPPVAKVLPVVDEVVPVVIQSEDKTTMHIVAADIPPDVSNTTTASVDSADQNTEPDLVAKKSVLQAQGKMTKKAK